MKPKLISPLTFKTSLGTYTQAAWSGTNTSGWTPIGDRVLVKPDTVADVTLGGVELPQDVVARQTMAAEAGTVVAKGPDSSNEISVGDRVSIERYSGQLVHGHDGEVYRLMDTSCIGAVFRKGDK